MAMRTDLYLRPMVVKPDTVKRIADFVRYKTNFVRQTQLTEMTEPDEFDLLLHFHWGLDCDGSGALMTPQRLNGDLVPGQK